MLSADAHGSFTVLCGQDDFQQFAVVRPTDDRMLNAGQLHPARPGDHPLPPHAFELSLEPALQAVDHLELHVVNDAGH